MRLADSIPGELSMVTQYTYDSYGRNNGVTYPSGIALTYVFDANNRGYLYQILNGSEILWQMYSSNNRGQPVRFYLGNPSNDLQVNFTYDTQGRLASKTTGQMKQTYSFDPASGNLASRDYRVTGSQNGLTETFEYDSLNRLTQATVTGRDPDTISYALNGNITAKSDAGNYYYDQIKVNAVIGITYNPETIEQKLQDIYYNSNNLTDSITIRDTSHILEKPVALIIADWNKMTKASQS